MADPAIEQISPARKRGGRRPRTGKMVACDVCGALHYRKAHKLRERPPAKRRLPTAGLRFCSQACRRSVEAKSHVVRACQNCGKEVDRRRSQAKASAFCSVECTNAYGLSTVQCAWPGCDCKLDARTFQKTTRSGAVIPMYKTDLRKKGEYTKYPFCQKHAATLNKYLGKKSRFTGGRSIVLSNHEHAFDSRAVSSRFIRMVIFARAEAKCQNCTCDLDWLAPPKTWEVDHITPIFRGGESKIANLQVLCAPCHTVKTAGEKSAVATERWHSQRIRGTRFMTHYEKDKLIAALRTEIESLRRQE